LILFGPKNYNFEKQVNAHERLIVGTKENPVIAVSTTEFIEKTCPMLKRPSSPTPSRMQKRRTINGLFV
jgi:hypothetical protein